VYLELDGEGPRYAQLTRALRHAILDGRIKPGARLPPTRDLASELGLSRNTAMAAYEQLEAEGFIEGRIGSGSYVSALQSRCAVRRPESAVPAPSRFVRRMRQLGLNPEFLGAHKKLRYNLQYGEPLTNPALTTAWRRELARAAAYTEPEYPASRGLPALRVAVCDYLARRRGVQAQPEDVLIVNGSQQALSLAARVLLDEGDMVVLEEPRYFGARWVFQSHGARIVGVPVDADGLVCQKLPKRAPSLIFVTPSHQFPTGSVMSLQRRLSLLRYAETHRSWIFEDDYDGEFRYDTRPIAALRSLDQGDRVIYVGTFSKALFPALRLGYMVLPSALRTDFVLAKRISDLGSSAVEQAALASFIGNGGFERHLRQSAKTLQIRRAALLSGLSSHAGDRIEVVGAEAGMHLVGWLRHCTQAQFGRLIALASERGLGLHPIAPYYMHPPDRPGLLIGYAGLSVSEIREATRLLGQGLDDLGL
jgi:GntR family transcriptional regulator/MocR family aminotransferase